MEWSGGGGARTVTPLEADNALRRVPSKRPRVPPLIVAAYRRLQDVFSTIGFAEPSVDLPQIVVVGSQSSGKSSV